MGLLASYLCSPMLEKLLGSPPVAFTSKYLGSQDAKRAVKEVLKAETEQEAEIGPEIGKLVIGGGVH